MPEQTSLSCANMEGAEDLTDGSDVAETGSVWWRGHFVKAGRSAAAAMPPSLLALKYDISPHNFKEAHAFKGHVATSLEAIILKYTTLLASRW